MAGHHATPWAERTRKSGRAEDVIHPFLPTFRSSRDLLSALGLAIFLTSSGCGIFATEGDHEALAARVKDHDKAVDDRFKELSEGLGATRDRLDNALRANADTGSDLVSEKARINQMAGRLDEIAHSVDELRSTLAAARTEIDARFDALKRAQDAAQAPAPPPVPIPPDKAQHYAAIEAAGKAKDWTLVRTLGHEYVNRYGSDDKADDVLYLMGTADLAESHPSSALGEFNRLLKAYPKSNVLDKTLFGMGDAYMAIHDCENAKLAYSACASRFSREKVGIDAKVRITEIEHAPAGTCAPP
jgi:TolA-binding protein